MVEVVPHHLASTRVLPVPRTIDKGIGSLGDNREARTRKRLKSANLFIIYNHRDIDRTLLDRRDDTLGVMIKNQTNKVSRKRNFKI